MRKDILYILLLLLITDLSIIADIPVLRQSLPFIFFTIIPGYLLVGILKFKFELIEGSIIAAALSIFLMMITGVIINSFYPIIMKPLSLLPLLSSINLLIIALMLIYHLRGEEPLNLKASGNLSAALSSLIFPVLTVIGSYLMNKYSVNTVLLLVLLFIPVYIILLEVFKKKIGPATYPVAIFSISLSLLIMNGLPSNYLIGRDIHWEFYLFRKALMAHHWDMHVEPYSAYNACLSVTVLPVIYKVLLNVPAVYIFKFYYGFIGALMALSVYLISERILKRSDYGFYTTLLFIFQFSFIYILGWCRQLVALLFFAAAVMVLTRDMRRPHKKLLFVVFMVGTVLSHYTTAYVFFFLVALTPLLVRVMKRLKVPDDSRGFFAASLAVLFFVVVFAWYAQATGAPFKSAVSFFTETLRSMSEFFSADMRNNSELAILGIGISNFPNLLSTLVHDTVFALIGAGVLAVIFKEEYRQGREYLAAVIICMGILVAFIALPFVSKGYGGTRLFTQLLVILAPLFITGIDALTGFIGRESWRIPSIIVLLILLFSCTTYLNYHFSGIPYSYAYDDAGERRYETFIYDSEVTGALWLSNHYNETSVIHGDKMIYSRIIYGFSTYPRVDREFFNGTDTETGGYVYLTHFNLYQRLVFLDYPLAPPRVVNGALKLDNVESINNYKDLIVNMSTIYDNGGSRVLIVA
ncbi:DUF2206 domain-containing protein [Methanothermobacter sp. EMTCatA1]|jgi:uncharacterized membrane protein|uniref:DUF2206 domain-containing protein n=1 Tax=Methanothermobacter sp. EMTCatA1 TaxID=2017966 RepID=UPI000B5E6B64|nr:DUF2206 domain-containing protein [Methanothermobacter sp. EMTCatA1]BAZ98383.1 hypothetical protein tca_00308 [Methanothermobacter sp. EMTCatA1]